VLDVMTEQMERKWRASATIVSALRHALPRRYHEQTLTAYERLNDPRGVAVAQTPSRSPTKSVFMSLLVIGSISSRPPQQSR
jgi:hypothetical protein